MMRLRVHHLLCSALYTGSGYSEDFCKNMQEIVDYLWGQGAARNMQCGEKAEIELVVSPDAICKECPNLVDESCNLDDNNVVSKDAKLADRLSLTTDRSYFVPELLELVATNLTEEIFETSCHQCEWYAKGLCRYEMLAAKYEKRPTV